MPANDNSNTLLKAKTTMLTLYSFYMASVDGGANAGANTNTSVDADVTARASNSADIGENTYANAKRTL